MTVDMRPTIERDFGMATETPALPAHAAYFWNSEKEFADAVRFLEVGLTGDDHCIVFGYDEANQAVCRILELDGFSVAKLAAAGRLTVLGGNVDADKMLADLSALCPRAVDSGAKLIRVLSNIGWGRPGWPEEKNLLAFEAKITEAIKQFSCVALCMYDEARLPGTVVRRGGFECHPQIFRSGESLENPHYVPLEPFLRQLEAVAAAVAERRRSEEILGHITEGIAGATGEEFFRSLAQHLAGALAVRYAFITECADPAHTRVRALAFWDGAGFAQGVEYPLRGTPCEKVIEGNICSYPERLQLLFLEDKDLVTLGAESFAGVPLADHRGKILGHLAVMDNKPRLFGEHELRILRLFATRAAVELERSRAEQSLRRSEAQRRMLLEINNAVITKLSRDELWRAIAGAVRRIVPFDRLALSQYDAKDDRLRIVTYAGPYHREDYTPLGRELKLDDSPAGLAFTTQGYVLRRDLEIERVTTSEERAYSHGFRSLCALPLIVRGQSVGAITMGSLNRAQYSEADAKFLMEVAGQISIAIDNMSAHEESQSLRARFEAEAVYLQEEIKSEHNFEEIIGQSEPVRRLLTQVEQVAPTDATVLIRGETGTGKELLARAVHDRSRRKGRPLVKVNCGAIPSGLVESELFGHEKGAFTGATQRRIGRFELADGGTIFLDEVTELPVDTQVKLLRILQEGDFERVGSSRTIKVDVRVIAATNRNLADAVSSGIFRTDLFYRLNVFPLEAPALRERPEDIPLLANFFLSRFAKNLGKNVRGLSQRSRESLSRYNWPGNIRELQNVIERAVVLATGPVVQIDESMLRADQPTEGASSIDTLENNERNHIVRALNETNWVIHGKKGAAEVLAINPSTLRSRMEKLGIKKPS
jgi:formate hydrogenlyase transcriptional activator